MAATTGPNFNLGPFGEIKLKKNSQKLVILLNTHCTCITIQNLIQNFNAFCIGNLKKFYKGTYGYFKMILIQ
jgi:hypothetical protein